MTKKFIAIAPNGSEFVFNRHSMIAVPTSSAWKIAKLLTDMRYRLKANEVWHVYDNDMYYNDWIGLEIKRFSSKHTPVMYAYRG